MRDPLKAAQAAAAYQQKTLPSGLTVLVRPMPGYSGVHAVYATRFGSVNQAFTLDGRLVRLPAGVAHFLEHKMFESEDGDAFAQYAKTGANANAFTSFDKTCYIFTATDKVDESLDVLLSMVGRPYFTEQTIAKEQGIIGQEIKMYEDSPEWRMLVELCGCLYHSHPVRQDIAGTVQSIAQITPQMLYDCCAAYYQPANMVLAVAGGAGMEQVLAACGRAGLMRPQRACAAVPVWPDEPAGVAAAYMELQMPVAMPFIGIGFKETPLARGDLAGEMICDILTELVCGEMTPLYRTLYDQGLVNPEFGAETLILDGCRCVLFTGESSEPKKVRRMLLDEIARLRAKGVDEELFTLCKNQLYGEMLCDLENIEATAGGMASSYLHGHTLADELKTLAGIQKQDVDAALQTMLREERSAAVLIRPLKETPQ